MGGATLSFRPSRRREAGAYLKAQPERMPKRRITLAAGQKPVSEDWIRFAPMNTVSQTK